MKHFLLPVLCWTLAISQSFAQKTVSPNLQSHTENWSNIVKKMMRSAGFDISSAPLTSGVQSRNKLLQLDSTKTFYGYNLNGVQDSTPLLRTIHQYPQNGVTVEIEAQFENGAWVPTTRTTQSSDALGRVVDVLAEVYDSTSGTYVLSSKVQVFPHGTSMDMVDSFQIFQWDAAQVAWLEVFKSTNTFDAQDRLKTTQTFFDFNGQQAVFLDKYFYNANQDNHLIESFLLAGPLELPTGKQELMYFNHQVIQTILYTSDGAGGFSPTDRNTYAYNGSNLVTEQNIYQWVPGVNDWNPVQIIGFKYDNSLRLSEKETEFILIGLPSEKERVTYAYVEDENLALETTEIWDAGQNAYSLDARKYYYYNSGSSSVRPSPSSVQALLMSPNPTADIVRFSIDTEAEVRVFDASGQMLQSRTVQPGETLNLTNLPVGMYQVIARSGATYFAGKVVKQ